MVTLYNSRGEPTKTFPCYSDRIVFIPMELEKCIHHPVSRVLFRLWISMCSRRTSRFEVRAISWLGTWGKPPRRTRSGNLLMMIESTLGYCIILNVKFQIVVVTRCQGLQQIPVRSLHGRPCAVQGRQVSRYWLGLTTLSDLHTTCSRQVSVDSFRYAGLVRRFKGVCLWDLIEDNWFRLVLLNGICRPKGRCRPGCQLEAGTQCPQY